ncbi:MAG: PIN domain-containing protein [Candidatus Dormibacteria bacterium]
MIILDTSVASELIRATPSPVVAAWVRAEPAAELYMTSITVAQIRYGIERLPDGGRKKVLARTAGQVFVRFADQVLPFDLAAALEYGDLVGHREHLGMPIDGFDAQIAAICLARGAALATRNVKDFEETGIELIDPWTDPTTAIEPPA